MSDEIEHVDDGGPEDEKPLRGGPKTSVKSTPIAPKSIVPTLVQSYVDVQVKLNVYTPAGSVRSSISTELLYDASSKYGDIMRAISSTRWMTLDEVCDETWRIEKKLKHPSNRTRKAIEDAVNSLVERSLVIIK